MELQESICEYTRSRANPGQINVLASKRYKLTASWCYAPCTIQYTVKEKNAKPTNTHLTQISQFRPTSLLFPSYYSPHPRRWRATTCFLQDTWSQPTSYFRLLVAAQHTQRTTLSALFRIHEQCMRHHQDTKPWSPDELLLSSFLFKIFVNFVSSVSPHVSRAHKWEEQQGITV